MFHEVYRLVEAGAGDKINADPKIPVSKRGALIAETTTALLHVFSQLNPSDNSTYHYDSCHDERFPEMMNHQLRWRLMLHLGFSEKDSDTLIQNLLPAVQEALEKQCSTLVAHS